MANAIQPVKLIAYMKIRLFILTLLVATHAYAQEETTSATPAEPSPTPVIPLETEAAEAAAEVKEEVKEATESMNEAATEAVNEVSETVESATETTPAPAPAPEGNPLFENTPLPENNSTDFIPDETLLMDPLPDISMDTGFTMPPPANVEQPGKELRKQIALRKARTKALKDPKLQEALHRAEIARTDLEKREALKEYYTGLFANMRKIDKTLEKTIDSLEEAAIARTTQTNVIPTEPLEP